MLLNKTILIGSAILVPMNRLVLYIIDTFDTHNVRENRKDEQVEGGVERLREKRIRPDREREREIFR